MDRRDDELDELLGPLRAERPTAMETRRWQEAVSRLGRAQRRRFWPLLAATAAGAALALAGSGLFGPSREDTCKQQLTVETRAAGATFERTNVKLD